MRTIMEGLGFRTEEFDFYHHDVYYKPPVSNFEMHRTLIDPDDAKELSVYYQNVQERLLGDGSAKRSAYTATME